MSQKSTAQPYMEEAQKHTVATGLTRVLADTYVLYFKTHSYHWNVQGPNFKSFHDLFEEQYTELWKTADDLAERIRALDVFAPTSWAEMVKYASLQETGQNPSAPQMVKDLAADNTAITETIMPVLRTAQEAGDEGTTDMMIERLQVHEKAAWMLNMLASSE